MRFSLKKGEPACLFANSSGDNSSSSLLSSSLRDLKCLVNSFVKTSTLTMASPEGLTPTSTNSFSKEKSTKCNLSSLISNVNSSSKSFLYLMEISKVLILKSCALIVSISSPTSLNALINASPTFLAIIFISSAENSIPPCSLVNLTLTPLLARSSAAPLSSVATYPSSPISSSSFNNANRLVRDSFSTSKVSLVFIKSIEVVFLDVPFLIFVNANSHLDKRSLIS